MKLLLDTHAFIWWDGGSRDFPPNILDICSSPKNSVYLSLASIWEIQIKTQLGKLSLRRPLFDVLTEQQQQNGIKLLPIELEDILSLAALPFHHRDPFDRLILAQTIRGGMHLVSHDTQMARYPAPVLWA